MSISSKISSYDFLTMMVSGFLWLFPLYIYKDLDLNPYELIIAAIICYIVGMLYHLVIERITNCLRLRNNIKMISYAYEKENNTIRKSTSVENSLSMVDFQCSIDDYYKAYYLIMQQNCWGNIRILEAQVAFVRNLFLIICVYILGNALEFTSYTTITKAFSLHPCCACILLFITLLLLGCFWYKKQLQIYQSVWEGGYYLSKLQREKQ